MASRNFILTLLVFGMCGIVVHSQGSQSIDVVILLDTSDSGRSANFYSEKQFVLKFVDLVSNGETRIGLLTYGSSTHSQFSLAKYRDKGDMATAIRYMWYSTGNGNPADAIGYTLDNAFADYNGNRDCTPNILVVVSHSSLENMTAASLLYIKLQDKLINTIVVRIGGNGAEPGFENLTSASRIHNIPNIAELEALTPMLSTQVYTDVPRTGCGVLTAWGGWTRCTRTCGRGNRLRTRECNRTTEADRECNGALSESTPCNMGVCTEPVDGSWAFWSHWGNCSKTCDSGVQTRTRACSLPSPEHGGKTCPGTSNQAQPCATWSCPDCSKTCPSGAHLSEDCERCECSSITLYGTVMDNMKRPVDEAGIYIQSSMSSPLNTTDIWGRYSVSGVCLVTEKLFVGRSGYVGVDGTPIEVNTTHWTMNSTVLKYVAPMFNTQPMDKVRMVGQSVSLCCAAAGIPEPTTYKWYKDGIELENTGTDGKLTITNLNRADAGLYICGAETEAGVSQTEEADLNVYESGTDTCGARMEKMQALPEDCFVTGDVTKNASFNVGTCGKSACVKSNLRDNGTCSEWWAHYCCDVKDAEMVNISCDGYSYQTSRIVSCECRPCIKRSVITGRAYGTAENGTRIPLKLGEIFVNGKSKPRTNMAGYFRVEVTEGTKRHVLSFRDTYFKTFIDTIKIVEMQEGTEVFVDVALPLRPVPISFNPSIGVDIQLGGDSHLAPVSTVSIPEDALIDSDGAPYTGPAKISMHFMDPRTRDSLEMASGDFVSESPSGERLPLRTYGIIHMGVEDDYGNALQLNKPMNITIDSSILNITSDENGEPDIALWHYDGNRGIWIQQSRMSFGSSTFGRRKLLQGGDTVTGTIFPADVPVMDPYDHTTRTEIRYAMYNYDMCPTWQCRSNCDGGGRHSWCRQEIRTTVKEDIEKEGICLVSVSVFTDFTNSEELSVATVTAYTQEGKGGVFLSKESKPVDEHGHVCLVVFCDKIVHLTAETTGGERLLPGIHNTPPGYPIISSSMESKEVKIESRYYGMALSCSDAGQTCEGPLYEWKREVQKCKHSYKDNSFKFVFAPFTRQSLVQTTTGSKNVYDQKLSWYPVSPTEATFRSCFIKAHIKVADSFDMRIIATSYLTYPGEQYGTSDVGPRPGPSGDVNTRGACIEFRCAGYVKYPTEEVYDKETIVEARITTKNKALKCKFKNLTGIIATQLAPAVNNGNGFTFVAEPGHNYGDRFGVFIADTDASHTEDFCNGGLSSGPTVDGVMDPTKNPAVEFDCL